MCQLVSLEVLYSGTLSFVCKHPDFGETAMQNAPVISESSTCFKLLPHELLPLPFSKSFCARQILLSQTLIIKTFFFFYWKFSGLRSWWSPTSSVERKSLIAAWWRPTASPWVTSRNSSAKKATTGKFEHDRQVTPENKYFLIYSHPYSIARWVFTVSVSISSSI